MDPRDELVIKEFLTADEVVFRDGPTHHTGPFYRHGRMAGEGHLVLVRAKRGAMKKKMQQTTTVATNWKGKIFTPSLSRGSAEFLEMLSMVDDVIRLEDDEFDQVNTVLVDLSLALSDLLMGRFYLERDFIARLRDLSSLAECCGFQNLYDKDIPVLSAINEMQFGGRYTHIFLKPDESRMENIGFETKPHIIYNVASKKPLFAFVAGDSDACLMKISGAYDEYDIL